MNKIRTHLGLIIALVIFVGLLGVSLFFLWRERSAMLAAKEQWDSAERNYERLVNSDPYPNQANVEQLEQNVAQTTGMYSNYNARMQTYNILIDTNVVLSTFNGEVAKRRRALQDKAAEKRIFLPESFGLGFDAYVNAGKPPADKNYLPFLLKQLQLISYLVDGLLEAEITQLARVDRLIFEAPTASPTGSSGSSEGGSTSTMPTGMMGENPLFSGKGTIEPEPGTNFTEYPFSLTFQSDTTSLRTFMNSLVTTNCPYFLVVKELTVRNQMGIEETRQFVIPQAGVEGGIGRGIPTLPGSRLPGTGAGLYPGYPAYPGREGGPSPYYGGYGAGAYFGTGMGEGALAGQGLLVGNQLLEVQLAVSAYEFSQAEEEK